MFVECKNSLVLINSVEVKTETIIIDHHNYSMEVKERPIYPYTIFFFMWVGR